MPELPEVETIVRRLRPEARGAIIRKVDVLRPRSTAPQSPSVLQEAAKKSIEKVERRGKNIILKLSGGLALRIHLRMTGMLRIIPDARKHAASTAILLTLKDGRGIAFEDMRALGTFHLYNEADLEAKLRKIGPEPLTKTFPVEYLVRVANRSVRPIKIFLMDQHIVAGLGNIYAAEALFEARIHPARPAEEVPSKKLKLLHSSIAQVLKRAIRAAGRTFTAPDRHEGMEFKVYGRKGKPCFVCGAKIATIIQNGRTTYFCPNCQRK